MIPPTQPLGIAIGFTSAMEDHSGLHTKKQWHELQLYPCFSFQHDAVHFWFT